MRKGKAVILILLIALLGLSLSSLAPSSAHAAGATFNLYNCSAGGWDGTGSASGFDISPYDSSSYYWYGWRNANYQSWTCSSSNASALAPDKNGYTRYDPVYATRTVAYTYYVCVSACGTGSDQYEARTGYYTESYVSGYTPVWVCCSAQWGKWYIRSTAGSTAIRYAGLSHKNRSWLDGFGTKFYGSWNDVHGIAALDTRGNDYYGATLTNCNAGPAANWDNSGGWCGEQFYLGDGASMFRGEIYGAGDTYGDGGGWRNHISLFGQWIQNVDNSDPYIDNPRINDAAWPSGWLRGGTYTFKGNYRDNTGVTWTGFKENPYDNYFGSTSWGCDYRNNAPCGWVDNVAYTLNTDTVANAQGEGSNRGVYITAFDSTNSNGFNSRYALNIDRTSPTLSSSNVCFSAATPAAGSTGLNCGWSNSSSVSITAADSTSGVASVASINGTVGAASTTYTRSFSCGANSLGSITSSDNAGNSANFGTGYRYFDNCAPTNTTTTPSTAWRSSPASVSLCASDNQSGLKNLTFSINGGTSSQPAMSGTSGCYSVSSSIGGTNNILYTFTDSLSNVSAQSTATVNIDNSTPVVSPSVASGAAGGCPAGWQSTSPVNCSVSATDTYSGLDSANTFKWYKNGVAQSNATMTGSGTAPFLSATGIIPCAGEGINNLTATAQDNVGNVSATTIVGTCRIDLTAPSGSVVDPSPNSSFVRGAFTPTATATDGGSGVASAVIQRSTDGGINWTSFSNCSAQAPVGEGVTSAQVVCDPYTALGSDGSSLQMRVQTTDVSGRVGNSPALSNTVDKTKPVTAVIDPSPASSFLRGSFTPSGTITDATSGSTTSGNAVQEAINSSLAQDFADLAGCSQTSNTVSCSSYDTTSRSSGTVQNLRMRGIDQARNDDYSASVLADSPLSYWTLDDTSTSRVLDDGSRSNDLSASGSVTAGATGPPTLGSPRAFSFSGGTLQSPTSPRSLNPTSAFTLEAWVKTSSSSTADVAGAGSYEIAIAAGKARGSVKIGGVWINLDSAASINDNKWNLVQFSYDGANMRIYVNGSASGSKAQVGALDSSTAAFIVGSSAFAGSLDQVAVYGSALTATQLNNHYISTPTQVSNTIDNTPPTLTFTAASGRSSQGWYNVTPVASSVSASDSHSGVKQIIWQDNGAPGGNSPILATSGSVSVSGQGTHNLSITAEDNIGNTLTKTTTDDPSYVIRIDTTKPTLTNPCPTAWTNTNVTCTFSTASDGGSGIQNYRVRQVTDITGSTAIGTWATQASGSTMTVSTEGITYWAVQASDNADNWSDQLVAAVKIDKTNPIGGQPSASRYVRGSSVTLQNATASDALSLVKTVDYRFSLTGLSGSYTRSDCVATTSTAPFTCSFNSTTVPDGDYYLASLVTDNAGNVAWSTNSSLIYIDNTLPTAGPLTLPTPPATDSSGRPIYRSIIAASTTGSDGQSGVASVKIQYSSNNSSFSDAPTEAQCDNMTATGGGVYACELDTSQLPDGVLYLRSKVTDRAGNVATGTSKAVFLDNTKPSVALQTIADWNKGVVPLSSSSTDGGSGVVQMTIERADNGTTNYAAVSPSCVASQATVSCNFDSTSYPEGTRLDFRAKAVDAAGNIGYSSVQTDRRFDNTAPTEDAPSGYTNQWRKTSWSSSIVGTDGANGIGFGKALYQYAVGLSCPPSNPTVVNVPNVASFTISEEGITTLCSQVGDKLDNLSSWQTRQVKIDRTKPTVVTTGIPASWTNSAPSNIVITGTDQANLSGIKENTGVSWEVRKGGVLVSGSSGPNRSGPPASIFAQSGTYAITTFSTDDAGNNSDNQVDTLLLDKDNPIDTTSISSRWNSTAQNNIVLSGVDQASLSGVKNIEHFIDSNNNGTPDSGESVITTENTSQGDKTSFSTTIGVSKEGVNNVYTRIRDVATNLTQWSKAEVKIDLTDPTISQEGGSDDWYNTDRQVTLSAADGQSGIDRIEWQYCNLPSSTKTACSEPVASLQSEPGASNPYYTDVTTPAKSGSEYPPATQSYNGQTTASKTLSFSQAGDRYLRARVVDVSGRSSNWVTIHVAIDKNDPSTSMSGQEARVNGVVELVATSSDSSGVGRSGVSRGWFQVCKSSDCDAPDAVWRSINQESLADLPAPACTPDMVTTDGNFHCNFDTRQYSDGQYSIRSVVRDAAGNTGYGSPRLNGQRFRNGTFCPASL